MSIIGKMLLTDVILFICWFVMANVIHEIGFESDIYEKIMKALFVVTGVLLPILVILLIWTS